MKTVTRWKHPSTDTSLILEGTPDETIECAKPYFEDSPHLMTGTQEEMSDEDFDKLPEFEG